MATHLLRATQVRPLDGWASHKGVSIKDVYWLPRPENFLVMRQYLPIGFQFFQF